MELEIPVIDLEELKGKRSQLLREACEKWGCFRVVNHGVSTELMAEMKNVAQHLFDRPVEIKQRNKEIVAGSGSGYLAPTPINPLLETFGIFDGSNADHVSSFCSDLSVSPHHRGIIEKYVEAIYKLATDVGSKMAASMGLEGYSFNWPLLIRINKYSFTKETRGSSGVMTHTDPSFLTILQDDEQLGGLEVMDPSSRTFVAVDTLPGTFLVNFGDIAVPWSNGRLRNVPHRVQCKGAGVRLSIATFLSPAPDKTIEAPPEFIDGEHPPLYVPFTYAQFREIRTANKMHVGEALELVRLRNV